MWETSLASAQVEITCIFDGSDAAATRSLYSQLEAIGPAGKLAANLLRAQKASTMAKLYRRGSYREMAYDRKQWAVGQVASNLQEFTELGITWGWKLDPSCSVPWVFYVELPPGQVSFHCQTRGDGPDYAGEWDGVRGVSPSRIIKFAAQVLSRQCPLQLQESSTPDSEEGVSCQEQLALAL